jgi:hypothetical protein
MKEYKIGQNRLKKLGVQVGNGHIHLGWRKSGYHSNETREQIMAIVKEYNVMTLSAE